MIVLAIVYKLRMPFPLMMMATEWTYKLTCMSSPVFGGIPSKYLVPSDQCPSQLGMQVAKEWEGPKHKGSKSFRILIKEYKERLYWHIRKIVISHDDADDVLQNTFIKVFKGIDNFKQESKLYSWMYRIATNESITFINKRARERNIDITEMKQKDRKSVV